MLLLGVDENGLGPRLGPLIATAIALDVAVYERARLQRVAMRVGIGDSKETSAFGQMSGAEGLSLAIVEALHGRVPSDSDELLEYIGLDRPRELRAPCPKASAAQCWSFSVALPAFGGDVAEGRKQLARLTKHGVVLRAAKTIVTCVGKMNAELRRLGSRTSVDLFLFERLLLASKSAYAAHEELTAILGMVGGIRDYPRYFTLLSSEHVTEVERTRGTIAYQVSGMGRLSFEIDADARHLPVALASMLGKYVRELCMERQNRFYSHHRADLPRPSGYYDSVTRRFMQQSSALRIRLGIADDCFERRAAGLSDDLR